MAKFEFPQNPGTRRQNPFEDEDGRNPFSEASDPSRTGEDDRAAGAPLGDVYASADHGTTRAYRPSDFVTTLPHRAGRVLTYGSVGLIISVVSLVFCVLAVVTRNGSLSLISSVPLQLIALALALPAWILGASDLRAIKAEAMDRAGIGRTRLGLIFGIIGVLLAVVGLGLVLIWIYLESSF